MMFLLFVLNNYFCFLKVKNKLFNITRNLDITLNLHVNVAKLYVEQTQNNAYAYLLGNIYVPQYINLPDIYNIGNLMNE